MRRRTAQDAFALSERCFQRVERDRANYRKCHLLKEFSDQVIRNDYFTRRGVFLRLVPNAKKRGLNLRLKRTLFLCVLRVILGVRCENPISKTQNAQKRAQSTQKLPSKTGTIQTYVIRLVKVM